jgi:hypothetical protein
MNFMIMLNRFQVEDIFEVTGLDDGVMYSVTMQVAAAAILLPRSPPPPPSRLHSHNRFSAGAECLRLE